MIVLMIMRTVITMTTMTMILTTATMLITIMRYLMMMKYSQIRRPVSLFACEEKHSGPFEADSTRSRLDKEFMLLVLFRNLMITLPSNPTTSPLPPIVLMWPCAVDGAFKKVASSNPGRSGERIFFSSQLCVLTLTRRPFHPSVTAEARKRPRSFCQKCRRQVTPQNVYTLDPTKSERADYAAVQAQCGNYS